MSKIVMLYGLPASGKSTYAKDFVGKSGGDWKRINKDNLRSMLDADVRHKKSEKFVLQARDALIELYLAQGLNVIVDDTNFNPIHKTKLKELAQKHGAQFSSQYFDTPLDVCIERDEKRADSVGEKVIRDMYVQYVSGKNLKGVYSEAQLLEESSDTPRATKKPAGTTFQQPSFTTLPPLYVPPAGKPHAILCDIDGTLAHMRGRRSPYDWDKVHLDDLDHIVKDVLDHYSDKTIIVVSGRSDESQELTEMWLKKHGIRYKMLLMRKKDDNRKDSIVKHEIFDMFIKDHFVVDFVLDDRNTVVAMWRSLGLKVLQVEAGDF
jgi:predicted kinase